MADYSVRAILSARDSNFTSSMKKAAQSVEEVKRSAGEIAGNVANSFKNVGTKATVGLTLPLIAGFKKAVDESKNFESAMTGVRKTTELTDKEFAQMSKSVIEMSKSLPSTTSEIAKVAEAAGQLGIEKDSLMDFTKVMIDLGNSTNLSAEEGAIALARFANVTGMSEKEFTNLGSTIVDLGNNFATSEREIVNMASRLAGTGSMVGLTESQILALSTSMSSLGIRAEAGGSAFSRVLQKMNTSVIEGGEKMQKFANIAGMTAEDFANSWRSNPQEAILNFLDGLKKANDEGLNTMGILDELGIKGIRETDTLLRMAEAGDLTAEAFNMANKAWSENTALADEAALRYKTFESRMEMVKNRIKEVARQIGDVLKPKVLDIAERFADWAEKFTELDDNSKNLIVSLSLIAAAIGPVLVVLGVLLDSVRKIAGGLKVLKAIATGASGSFKGLGVAIGGVSTTALVVVGAIAAFAGALKLAWSHSEKFRDTVRESFESIKESASDMADKFKSAFSRISDALNPVKEAISNLAKVVGGILGDAFSVIVKLITGQVKNAFQVLGDVAGLVAGVFEGLSPIVAGLIDFISGLASVVGAVLGPAFELIGDVITILLDKFGEFLGFIANLASGIQEELNPVLELFGDKLSAMGEFLTAFSESLRGFLDDLKGKFSEIPGFFVGIWESINEGVTNAWSGIKEFFSNLWTEIKTNASNTWESIKTTVLNIVTPMVEGIKDIFGDLKEGLSTIWDSIKSIATNTWELIKQAILGPITALLQILIGDWEGAESTLSQVWENIKTAASNIWNGIKDVIKTAMDTTHKVVEKIVNAIKDVVVKTFETIKSKIKSVMDNIKSNIRNAWDNIKSTTSNTVDNVKSVVTNGFNTIKNTIQDIMNGVKNIMQNAWNSIKNFIQSAIDGIKSVVEGGMTGVKNSVKNGVSGAVSAAGSFVGSFTSVGRNLIDGLVGGIKSMASRVASAARNVVQNAINAARSALQIRSPSRVFMKIGEFTGKGMEIGINDSSKGVVKSINSMAKDAVDGAKRIPEALDGLNSSYNFGINAGLEGVNRNISVKGLDSGVENKEPMTLKLVLGGREFGAFVDDISKAQGKDLELREIYGL